MEPFPFVEHLTKFYKILFLIHSKKIHMDESLFQSQLKQKLVFLKKY
jgi:hypothetical protein